MRAHKFTEPGRVWTELQKLAEDPEQRRHLARIFPQLLRACERGADPDRAFVNFARLVAALPNPNMFYRYLEAAPDRLGLLVRVFTHSQALADTLTRNAAYFHFLIAPPTLEAPRSKAWMTAELHRRLLPNRTPADRYDAIRRFRRRETLRIGVRDLMGRASVEETTLELSNLADVCLQGVFNVALSQLAEQYRLPAAARQAAAQFAVIGMGKLGGQELNYSSDVDLIFVYGEDGALTPRVTRHEFFTKLAEEITRAVRTATVEGSIFRIDLRLRPEGASGPLASSLANSENYYAERGETWERMALIKARPVAGNAAVGQQFLELVAPFVYSRHASENVIKQMAAIKQRIEQEIVTDERLTRHVKLGIGGIREIEFIVQSFQVLRGARNPALRDRGTLRTLAALAHARLLGADETRALADAYRFLRNVEHRLQMEMELQTHTIPDEERALVRLARSLDFATVEDFFAAQHGHTAAVRRIYAGVLAQAEQSTPAGIELLQAETLAAALTAAGFADVPAALKQLDRLQHGSGVMHVSQRTKELFAQLLPALLDVTRQLADPDGALMRFEQFVEAYGSRGLLFELFVRHPRLADMLLRLGDASRFLSETLRREPDLFDAVCRGATLSEPKGIDQMFEQLVATVTGNRELPALDVVRQWQRAELLRIGIEDVMGLVDLEQVQREMTCLAEVCLRLALHEARRELKLAGLPFAVIGMGKFGGEELGYGADLDVLFVGGHDAGDQAPAVRLAAKVIEFMTQRTEQGMLFPVDARLRPDGEKGSLASSLGAHTDYYRQRAQLWERQSLTKARFVAGDEGLGRKFVEAVHGIIYAGPLRDEEAQRIRRMRHRIETERGDQNDVWREFKTGPGGLMDIEFLIQAEQLRHGHAHPQLRTPQTLAVLNRLTALGLVDESASLQLRRHYLWLRRVESVLRRQENSSVSRLPAAEPEQTMLARRLGLGTATGLVSTYRKIAGNVREIYEAASGAL